MARRARRPPPTPRASPTQNQSKRSFGEPTAVARDSSDRGHLRSSDSAHDRVIEFNAKHEYLRQFGKEGSGEGQFSKGIAGIAVPTPRARSTSQTLATTASRSSRAPAPTSQVRISTAPAPASWRTRGRSRSTQAADVWVLDTFNYRIQEFSGAAAPIASNSGHPGHGQQARSGWPSAWPSPAATCMSLN